MKYVKPELQIVKITLSEIASSVDIWLDNNGTKDTALNSFYVNSL